MPQVGCARRDQETRRTPRKSQVVNRIDWHMRSSERPFGLGKYGARGRRQAVPQNRYRAARSAGGPRLGDHWVGGSTALLLAVGPVPFLLAHLVDERLGLRGGFLSGASFDLVLFDVTAWGDHYDDDD